MRSQLDNPLFFSHIRWLDIQCGKEWSLNLGAQAVRLAPIIYPTFRVIESIDRVYHSDPRARSTLLCKKEK